MILGSDEQTDQRRWIMNEELKKLVEDWAAAELRGDATFLGSALADDFIGIGPRGFMLTKDQWLERHESGKLRYESIGWDEVQVRPYGDAAVVTGRQSAEGKYEDYDLRDQFRGTLVFVKQRGRWLLAGLHLSPIAGRP
jgi:ketosteroid isomerase-like protein